MPFAERRRDDGGDLDDTIDVLLHEATLHVDAVFKRFDDTFFHGTEL